VLCQLLWHQGLLHLRQPLWLEGLISNFGPNIYFHYYDYIDYTKGNRGFGHEHWPGGARGHIRGPATLNAKSFARCSWEDTKDEGLRGKDLHAKRISKKKALKVKTRAPRKANKSCCRSEEGNWSPNVKTSETPRHLELDALGIRTCIG
jgi:hypothetical protein